MSKKNIALFAGGYTGEHEVSLKTAITIENNLSNDIFNVFKIIITKQSWYHELEDGSKVPLDKNDCSLTINGHKILFDGVFIAMHGTPGEDGRIQGYLDMLDIPYTTCNAITSALTFNKSFCNKVVKDSNIVQIANSIVLYKNQSLSIGFILEHLQLPLIVKPNESGSSLGLSKVKTVEELLPAISKAFEEDTQVIVEEFISGRELTMGVYAKNGQVYSLPPTEIILQKDKIFDFEAKYSSTDIAKEVTPAAIDDTTLQMISSKAQALYKYLNCKGVVRIDFIVQHETNKLYFLEVNTMPGQSEKSIIPQQLKCAGITLSEFYNNILLDCLDSKS